MYVNYFKVLQGHCVFIRELGMQPPSSEQTDEKYGGAEGSDAMYVKLVSSDDHEFYVRREYALTSGTIKAMLSGPVFTQFCETTIGRTKRTCINRLQKSREKSAEVPIPLNPRNYVLNCSSVPLNSLPSEAFF
ncbi:transcription elongation factor B, polypeptide 1 [Paragonimus westermani]|uniref:Transcription elongation factor B, polypeptide 1 n=1 Tax=Paragonimus westermani TaxID=34504 RepID=A0A5J4N7C4_9TREM|nr:transcription elongation factor B, polypeptide 1 [Paragonimus westermani]